MSGRYLRQWVIRILLLLPLLFSEVGLAASGEVVSLTEEEKNWLAEHPVIRLGTVPNWAPISMRDSNNQLSGIAGDYKERIEQLLGIHFELVSEMDWRAVLEGARNKEIDVVLPVGSTPDRDTFLAYSQTLFDLPYVIITQLNHMSVWHEKMLSGMPVAVAERYVAHEWLKTTHPDIPLVLKKDTLAALQAVATGEAHAYVGDFASASYFIETFGIGRLKVAGKTSYVNSLHIGVRKDWPILASIIDKALNHISEQERRAIWLKWVTIEPYGISPSVLYLLGAVFFVLIAIVAMLSNRRLRSLNHSLQEVMLLRAQELKHVEYLAYHDTLTGLPNRESLTLALEAALVAAQADHSMLAVCYLDIDDFKPINDTHGHEMGDRLLVSLAQRLQEKKRVDDLVVRLGGDEFVLLMVNLQSLNEVMDELGRILHVVVESPFVIQDKVCKVSLSIGVAIYPNDMVDADTLIRHADQAMYRAKLAGRNCFEVFDGNADQHWQHQTQLIKAIERAIARDEFRLFYQPKVDLLTGKVAGAEALIRWQHPEQGLLAPVHFLPSIEDTAVMQQLDMWVLKTAWNQLSRWQKNGQCIPVSVNVSPQSLSNPRFPKLLADLLALYPDLMVQCIALEVVESSAIADMESIIQVMRECVALGVRFDLDDFGTGYSSLTYLRRLPATTIKIDQSFVRGMLHNAEDLAIVQGVIALAKAFKLKVVAEGVESEAHGVQLIELGCDMAQGYSIAKPMPVEAFEQWLETYQPNPHWLLAQQKT